MTDDLRRKVLLPFLALLGIAAGGVYLAVDTTGPAPSAAQVLSVHSLTWWSPCSAPPSHPFGEVDNLQSDIAQGKQVAGYFLIAPPLAFGLPDTPEGEVEAGKRSADLARQGIPDDVWSKLLFASGDTEVPGVCSPAYDVPIATIDAAMAEMATMKCLANVPTPCLQVNYTSWGEWLSHVKPYIDNRFPANTLLWLADWNGDPSFASSANHLFGGLTLDDILLKQYQGDTLLNGQTVDLDSIDVDPRVFAGVTPTPAPLPEPTPLIVTLTPSPACAAGDVEWSPGECAHWDPALQAWKSPLRTLVPLADGHQLWFDAGGRLLSP